MAFDRSINLSVNASGVQSGAKQTQSAIKQVISSVNSMNSSLNSSSSALSKFSRSAVTSATAASGAFDTLHTSATKFKQLMASIGVVFTAKTVIDTIDAYTLMNARLKLIAKSQSDFNVAQKDVVSVAQDTRVSLTDTVQLYTRIARALDGTGTSLEEVKIITQAVSQGLVISGATAGEAAAGMLQLSQAFNKGKLDGDEFRTVMELMPPVAKAIAKEMGVTRGALLDLAPQGKITADIMKKAMIAASEEIQAQFNKFPTTIGQALQTLGNQFVVVAGQGTSAFGVGGGLVSAITLLRDNLADLLSGATLAAVFFAGRFVGAMIATRAAVIATSGAIGTLATAMQLLTVRGGLSLVLSQVVKMINPITAFATLVGGVAVAAFYAYSKSASQAATQQAFVNKQLEYYDKMVSRAIANSKEENEATKQQLEQKIALTESLIMATEAERENAKAKLESAIVEAITDEDTSEVIKYTAALNLLNEKSDASKDTLTKLKERLKDLTDIMSYSITSGTEPAAKKYEKLIKKLKEQAAAAGLNKTQQAVLNNINRAGIDITNLQVDASGALVGSFSAEANNIAKLTVAIQKKNLAYKQSESLKTLQQEAIAIDYNTTQQEVANVLKQNEIDLNGVLIQQNGTLLGIYDESAIALAKQAASNAKAKATSTKDLDAANEELQIRIANFRASKSELAVLIEANKLKQEGVGLDSAAAQKRLAAVEANAKINEQYELMSDLASSVDNSFDSALDAALKGTKSLGEAFKDLVVDIGAAIVKATILAQIQSSLGGTSIGGSIASGLSSFFGGFFADGGEPPVGRASLVGEEGPELFVPKSAGTVISNDNLSSLGGRTSVSVSNPVQVNIINQGTAQEQKSTQESTGPDGQKIITVIVDDIVNKGISSGKYDASARNSWGVSRRGS